MHMVSSYILESATELSSVSLPAMVMHVLHIQRTITITTIKHFIYFNLSAIYDKMYHICTYHPWHTQNFRGFPHLTQGLEIAWHVWDSRTMYHLFPFRAVTFYLGVCPKMFAPGYTTTKQDDRTALSLNRRCSQKCPSWWSTSTLVALFAWLLP